MSDAYLDRKAKELEYTIYLYTLKSEFYGTIFRVKPLLHIDLLLLSLPELLD